MTDTTHDRQRVPQQRRPDLDSLYCINEDGSRNKIHPADVQGRFQRRKKIAWTVLVVIYLALPWLRIDGRPAVLFDIPARNFFLFGATFNSQDFYLAFFVVTGLGFTLFVVSALWGRVWCGYACPHTVFLEGFYRRVERWIEGGATQRKRLQEGPWNANKIVRRGLKWSVFALISLGLSHTFLSYFMGVDGVQAAITHSPAEHPVAFAFVASFTVIIYFNFAWFREQMCIVVCPYGRLQGVLYDHDTVNVTYDTTRGEPRGRYTESKRGDCIDCFRCVAVCPTGIDIRNGTQLECVGCANCIDACDEVMTKIGQPTGLIRYDSQRGVDSSARRFLRPRVFVYALLLAVGATVFAVAAWSRTPFEAKVLSGGGGLPYVIEGETLRASFTLRLRNKQPGAASFTVEPVVGQGSDGIEIVVPVDRVELQYDVPRDLRFEVAMPVTAWRPGTVVGLRVLDIGSGAEQVVEARVAGPGR